MNPTGLLVVTWLILGAAINPCLAQTGKENKKEQKDSEESLKEVILALHKTMEGGKLEEQEKALKAILPSRKDLEVLFPKHAEKLWPLVEESLKEMVKNTPKVAKGFTRNGSAEKVELTNGRIGDAAKKYRELFAIIPKDIPLYEAYVHKTRGGSSMGTWIYVNKRWVYMRDFDIAPEAIKELEKKP